MCLLWGALVVYAQDNRIIACKKCTSCNSAQHVLRIPNFVEISCQEENRKPGRRRWRSSTHRVSQPEFLWAHLYMVYFIQPQLFLFIAVQHTLSRIAEPGNPLEGYVALMQALRQLSQERAKKYREQQICSNPAEVGTYLGTPAKAYRNLDVVTKDKLRVGIDIDWTRSYYMMMQQNYIEAATILQGQ